nr:synaptobrevin, longin-like domain protein [Tanacetum cinerariifolium]
KVSLPDGVKGLVATIDGTAYTITEASIRSALQLDDLNATDTLTNAEIFDGLRAIGYATEGKFTFFKNKFSPKWKFLIHTLIHCISPKSGSWNQFASNIAIALICLSTGRKYNFSNMIFNGMCHNVSSRTKFLMYPRFLQIILDTKTEDTTPYPAPLITKKFFANMRHYQGPDMPLVAYMLNQREPALVQAQPQEVSPPPPSPVVEPHPSPDPMPSPPRHPTAGVAEEPLTLTSLLALFPTCLQRIATLEAKLKATKMLHKDTVNEEEARQSQELDALLHLANAALHDPSASTTPSKPVNQEQSSEQEISPTTLDAVLTLSQSKARTRATTIIYKCIKKQQSSSGLDFTDAAIPAVGRVSTGGADPADVVVSAGGADSAGTFISAGVSVAAGPSVSSAPSSPIRDPAKGKAVATPSSPRVAEEHERESRASAAQSTPRQVELDRIALNLTNEEWIGLVDQVQANPTLSAELLGDDVSEDTFSVRMVELMNHRWKAIAEMKAKAKRDKPLTPAQQKEYMHAFVKNQSTTIYTTCTEQSAELQETTSVSAGATITAGDPISAVPSVFVVLSIFAVPSVFAVPSISAASSIPAETPIVAGVSTTAGVSELAGVASVPIIDLLDSPPKATSLPLDPETAEQAKYLRQVSDDDELAEPVSLSLVSDIRTWEVIPTEFGLGEIHVITRADGNVKRFSTLRELMYWVGRADLMVLYGMVSNKYKLERATGIGLGLWSDLRIWRFYAVPAIHVLETEAGDIMYMFVDKKYPILPTTIQRTLNHGLEIDRDPSGNDLTTAIQLIQSLLNQLHPAA